MVTRLDIPKAVQAAAVVLQTDPDGRMSYMRLLKLLYVVERESLKERATTVLGDQIVAMKHGLLLSELYDLIKGEHTQTQQLARFIRTEKPNLRLISPPGVGKLSRWEIAKIHEVVERYALLGDWELVDHLHDTLPEWKQPAGDTSVPVDLSEILSAVGRGDQVAEIEADLRADSRFAAMLEEEGA